MTYPNTLGAAGLYPHNLRFAPQQHDELMAAAHMRAPGVAPMHAVTPNTMHTVLAAQQACGAVPMQGVTPSASAAVMMAPTPAAAASLAAQASLSYTTAPTVATATATGGGAAPSNKIPSSPNESSEESVDSAPPTEEELRAMPVPQLMGTIHPEMLYELQLQAPSVIDGLLAQQRDPPPAPPTAREPARKPRPLRRTGAEDAGRFAAPGDSGGARGKPGALRRTRGGEFSAGSDFAAAAAQAAAEVAAARAKVGTKRNAPSASTTPAASGGEDNREHRKQLRAERNRQSAASSRERKKAHITELRRRLALLEEDNARLESKEIDAVRARVYKEKELTEENTNLKVVVQEGNEEIDRLKKKVETKVSHRVPAGATVLVDKELKRPSTWDNGKLGDSLKQCLF